MRPLFDPAEFRIAPGVAHVCAGGETAFLRRHGAALDRYAADKSDGMPGRAAQEAMVERARALVGQAWGVPAGDVGFTGSVAEGVAMVFESIDWRPGDTVCLGIDEYPSVAAPFLMGRAAVRLAPRADAEALAPFVDASTQMIAVTYVSYLDGSRVDLAALRRLADGVGALLVVDFTQAAGYLPIEAGLADFAFSACYKWLLGMTGVAIAVWNRARQPGWAPASAGWHSLASGARPEYGGKLALREDGLCFTRGNPAHGAVYVLVSALSFLAETPVAAVQAHVQSLTADLLGRLAEAGIPTTTPTNPSRHGASVCIASPRAQAIVDAMTRRGAYAWNGRGRIRFSFHGYNGTDDVDRSMTALQAEWG